MPKRFVRFDTRWSSIARSSSPDRRSPPRSFGRASEIRLVRSFLDGRYSRGPASAHIRAGFSRSSETRQPCARSWTRSRPRADAATSRRMGWRVFTPSSATPSGRSRNSSRRSVTVRSRFRFSRDTRCRRDPRDGALSPTDRASRRGAAVGAGMLLVDADIRGCTADRRVRDDVVVTLDLQLQFARGVSK